MARKFVSASNQTGGNSTFAGVSYPFTMAHWFNTTILGGSNQNMVMLYPSTNSGFNNIGTGIDGASSKAETFTSDTIGTFDVNILGSVALTTGVWHHIAMVCASSNNKISYLDGVATPTTFLQNLLSQGNVSVGNYTGGSGVFNGSLAEIAFWSSALTPNEINSLVRGAATYSVRPNSLLAYWPMWGLASPEVELGGGRNSLTLANTPTKSNHAPITLWTPKRSSSLILTASVVVPDTLGQAIFRVRQPGWQW